MLSGPNPGLKPLGYLITMMNVRKSIHKLYEETLRAQFGPGVFETRMTEAVDYVEALNQRLPVAQYKPRGAAAKTMKALADELDRRLEASRDGVRVRPPPRSSERRPPDDGQARQAPPDRPGQRRREHGGGGPGPHRPGLGLARCNRPRPRRRPGATAGGRAATRTRPSSRPTRSAPTPTSPARSSTRTSSKSLAESLRTRGQLQPITVYWDEGRGLYVIVCGERRWRAAKLAGMTTMTATILGRAPEPGERLALQLIENLLRSDLRPVEQAKAYRQLMGLQRVDRRPARPRTGRHREQGHPRPRPPRAAEPGPGAGRAGNPAPGDGLRDLEGRRPRRAGSAGRRAWSARS